MNGRFARITGCIPIVILILLLTGLSPAGAYDIDESTGVMFTLTVTAVEGDTFEYDGVILGDNIRMCEYSSGIETVALNNDDGIFILTPAIRTAREVEDVDVPSRDEDGWESWLMEPGRINPLDFTRTAGVDDDYDGDTTLGDAVEIVLTFSEGILTRIQIPSGDGTIVYSYSGFANDETVNGSDFEIPSDYLVSE